MSFSRILPLVAIVVATLFNFPSVCQAEDEQPIAIRHWPGGGFTIETQWGLCAAMGLSDEVKSSFSRNIDLDVSEMQIASPRSISRTPNAAEIKSVDGALDFKTLNAVSAIRVPMDKNEKGKAGTPNITVVSTNLSLIINLNEVSDAQFRTPAKLESLAKEITKMGEDFGVSPVVIASHESHDKAFCEKMVELLQPRMLIVSEKVKQVGEVEVEPVSHNTVAVSKSAPELKKIRIVSLGTTPYEMSDTVKELFARKEAACAASRNMFAKLSIEQMNFKPANGSHTPRWNVEHMMGRELGFFSQIYNAVDPSIPVMNLNPKQMPKDYTFAHDDWDGAEEARQMKRVEDFTRRFAYLLDGMDLDRKAKGSRFWSPRALLKQMERHYNEHSANVVKKMKLDGWPSDKN